MLSHLFESLGETANQDAPRIRLFAKQHGQGKAGREAQVSASRPLQSSRLQLWHMFRCYCHGITTYCAVQIERHPPPLISL